MNKESYTTKWNWGAFIDPFGFGIGNRAYLGLLVLVPVLNIIWIFVSGAKGEQWALANPKNNYRDEQEFRSVMDSWKRAGFVHFLIIVGIIGIYLLLAILGFGILSMYSQ